MISGTIEFLNSNMLELSFFTHMSIFLGGLYIAIYNRTMPVWHITFLWYLALASAFTSATVALEWYLGPEFEMSYHNIGILGESLSLVILSIISWTMVSYTVHKNNKKKNLTLFSK